VPQKGTELVAAGTLRWSIAALLECHSEVFACVEGTVAWWPKRSFACRYVTVDR